MNYELRKLHEFIVPRLNMKQLGIPMDIGEIPKQELSFATFLNRKDAESAEEK